MRTAFIMLAAAWSAALCHPCKAADLPDATLATSLQATVRLFCINGGLTSRATGFVVGCRKDHVAVIITAAHLAPAGNPLAGVYSALLSSDKRIVCEPIAYDPDHDLMALWPIEELKVEPFTLLSDSDPQPGLLHDVWLLGSAQGTKVSVNPGKLNAPAEAAGKIVGDLLGRWKQLRGAVQQEGTTRNLLNVHHDTLIIRHNADSGEGCSGGPIIDNRGRVVCIQQSALTNVKSQCFAIPARYVFQLDLNGTPESFKHQHPEMSAKVYRPLSEKPIGDPLTLKVANQEVNVQCSCNDSIPSDLDEILTEYLPGVDTFRKRFLFADPRAMLKGLRPTQIRNDVMGFSFLVPQGYVTVTAELERPGIVVASARLGDNSPGDERFILRAFWADDYRSAACRVVQEFIATDKYGVLGEARNDLVAQCAFFSKRVKKEMVDRVLDDFLTDVLRFRRTDDETQRSGDKGEQLFRRSELQYHSSVNGAFWVSGHFLSGSEDIGHAVQCGVLQDVAVIVHCKFNKHDFKALEDGKTPDSAFLEQLFMRATVSLY